MKYRRIKAAEGRHPHPHGTVKQQAFNGTMLKFTSQTSVTSVHRVFDEQVTLSLKLHLDKGGDY